MDSGMIMTLAAEEFIRRFLIHVLPQGFQRIRYYGFLANRHRAQGLALCRQLLRMPTPIEHSEGQEKLLQFGGVSPRCPVCGEGMMVWAPLTNIDFEDSS